MTREEKIALLKKSDASNMASSGMSREEKIALLKQSDSGQDSGSWYDPALRGIAKVGEFADKYTGAPTRAAIDEAAFGKGLISGIKKFRSQFGEDPSLAPTGKQIAQKAAVPDTSLSEIIPGMYSDTGEGLLKFKKGGLLDPTASGAAGLGVDIAADPTNLIPAGLIGKGISKTASGIKAAADVPLNAVGKAGSFVSKKVGPKLSNAAINIGEALTGVPSKEIETYVKNYDKIEDIIKSYGDSIPDLADNIRAKYADDIFKTKEQLGKSIGSALASEKGASIVDVSPVISKLEESKAQLTKKRLLDQVADVDADIEHIKGFIKDPASLSVTAEEANFIKEYLQEQAKGSYQKGGQIFSKGKDAAKASKFAAREARKIVDSAVPEVAIANSDLAKLHLLEEKMNKRLIAPGTSEAGLIAAGSGANQRNVKQLQQLEKITGKPFMEKAEELSAVKRFAKPAYLPADTTGKSLTRMALGGLAGFVFGGPVGAAVGSVSTSPAAVKAAIKAGKINSKIISSVVGGASKLNDATVNKFVKAIGTEKGAKALEKALKASQVYSVQEKNNESL